MDRHELETLVESQLDAIKQKDLASCITDRLIVPRIENRDWDYGEPGATFPCWLCVEDPSTNTGIAYCEKGFGPTYPWGLVFLEGQWSSIGMDSQWFVSLEEAARSAPFWLGDNPPAYAAQ
jgi:hypothetical protein